MSNTIKQLKDAQGNAFDPKTSIEALTTPSTGGGGNFLTTKDIDGEIKVVDTDISLEDVFQTVTVGQTTTGEPGTNATVTNSGTGANAVLDFTIPRGQDGNDGHNPNLGTYKLVDGTITPTPPEPTEAGDFITVLDETDPSNVTGTIYKWDSTLSTPAWVSTGRDSNMAYFGSGELLADVNIDDTHLVNPADGSLPKAEDVIQLKAKLEGVTASETKVQLITSGEWQNIYDGYINGETGGYVQSNYNKFIVVPLNGAKSVRWLGKENASNSSNLGWAFGTFSGEIDSTLSTFTALSEGVYANNPLDNQAVEYVKNAIEGATHAVITIWIYQSGGGSAVTMDNFYCYLQSGESVVNLIEKFDYPITVDVDLDNQTIITDGTIRATSKLWDNSTYAYNKCIFIPVHNTDIVEILGPNVEAGTGTQYAFLRTNTILIGETPDFAEGTSLMYVQYNKLISSIVPVDANYLYILYQQSDSNTGTKYLNRKPQSINIRPKTPYVYSNDIVDNFDSTDKTKVLSAALGAALKPLVEAGKPINRISPLGGQKVQGANLYYADGAWTLGTGRSCTFVDIQGLGIKKIQVVAGNHTAHFGFVSDFTVPENGVEGLESTYASIIDQIYTLNANTSVDIDVPSETKFIYFNISGQVSGSSSQTYVPKEVNILEQDSNIEPIIPSWDNNYDYETYVEENYYDEYKSQTFTKQKFYKIDHNAEYKLLLFGSSAFGTPVYGITTYNSSYNIVRTLYPWGNGTTQNVIMDDLVFQEDETYVRLYYYHYLASGAYGPDALGALMRKLKNDAWVPTNSLIYCVSKIKSPVMPYDYQEADTTFAQTDEWSAWDFVMPYNYNRVLFTNKKFPICTFFHGSSGWDSPDNMGYASSSQIMSASHGKTIVGMLREAGYVVFDINGYGISRVADDKSRHWGNPMAVSTVKKAYEILVDRFNCRRGMVISGISMGGAIAKSYCMTYPGDVVCAALEAPSELGGTCRFSVTGGHNEGESQTSAAHAWGYENAMDMYADNDHTAFIGYSPCIAPNAIDGNGFIKKIVQTDWNNQSTIFSNLSNFSCNFPVEIKIWHGDADTNVPLKYSQWFVNTVRNANGNATLRLCPGCVHDLNNYPWVRQEVVNYIDSKMKI